MDPPDVGRGLAVIDRARGAGYGAQTATIGWRDMSATPHAIIVAPLRPSTALSTDLLLRALAAHADAGGDPSLAAAFAEFAHMHEDCFERSCRPGHFTGSAWLVSADGRRVLLTHHRKLGRWLQLGGHADGDPDLAAVALREAGEESGLSGLVVEMPIFDLDRHWIPERAGEPGHWHYDVRYVVRAAAGEAFEVGPESLALAWREIAGLAADPAADASLGRMAARWLARAG